MCRWLQATDANYATTQMLGISGIPALASYDTSGQFRLKRSLLPCFSKNTDRPQRKSDSIFKCARKNPFQKLVEPVGIEPTTPCLQSRCSPS